MYDPKFCRRLGGCALVLAICFSAGASQARDRSSHQVPRHADDFYAYVPTSAHEPAAAPAASQGCFTTNSPSEATRGIRHWNGHC